MAQPQPQPATAEQVAELMRMVEATHRAATDLRRRLARVAVVAAVLLGVAALYAGAEWLQTRADIAAVQDRALVSGLGMELPDPRPAIERGTLRFRATAYGMVALFALLLSASAAAFAVLLRPAPLPPRGAAASPPER